MTKQIPNFVAGAKYKGIEMGPVVSRGRLKVGATRQLTIPGRVCNSVTSPTNLGANVLVYDPWVLDYPATLESVSIEMAAGGSAGSGLKVGVCAADVDWVPTGPLLWNNNASPFAIQSTGVKTASGIGLALTPGRYLTVFVHSSTATHAPRRFWGDQIGGIYRAAIGTTPFLNLMWRTAGNPWYAPGIPDPVPGPDNFAYGAVGLGSYFAYDLSVVSA
jgi:hypothetical protein